MSDGKLGVICQRLAPIEIPEHDHTIWQIALPGMTASIQTAWHTATGRQHSKQVVGDQIVIIPANQPHAAYWHAEADIMCFFIHPQFATQSLQDSLKTDSIELVEQYGICDPFIQQLGRAVQTEFQMTPVLDRLYLESVTTVLAVHLIRQYSTNINSLCKGSVELPPPKLAQVIDYIHAHLRQDLTLSQMAGVAHLSPHYFARSFKQTVGLAPHQYVRHQRIEAAKRLLAQRWRTIGAIAQELGFRSQSHFCEVFRKHTGVTPTTYRKQL